MSEMTPAGKVTVVGTGFAALTAVRSLRALAPDLEITVVGKSAQFVYLPGLIWIPSGLRRASDLVVPLERFFRKMRVRFHAGLATGLEDGGRTLVTDRGQLSNDALLIASGGRYIKQIPGIEHAIIPCEGVAAGEQIRDRLRAMDGGSIAIGFSGNPREPSAMRGGPMFEFLFGIDRQLRREGRRERFRIMFFSPATRPGARMGERAVGLLMDRMRRSDIQVRVGHKLTSFADHKVTTEGGEFDADLILFMPGITGLPWYSAGGLPLSEGGLIRADQFCRVEGMQHCYVAGDAGSFPGPEWLPKQAHMADLQAVAAARNLLSGLLGNRQSISFKMEMVCIVDSLDRGMVVARTAKHSLVLPPSPAFHWLKRLFEWWYLRRYR